MKKLFAIILMLLILTACSEKKAQTKETEPAAEPQITEENVQEEDVPEEVGDEDPADDKKEDLKGSDPAEEPVEYTSLMINGGVEDSVGFGFEIPVFDCPGSEKIGESFDELVQNMENYTKDVVYEEAMSRSCIASVSGRVDSAVMAGDLLQVTYSYACHYSDAEEPEVETTVMCFDMITGDLVE